MSAYHRKSPIGILIILIVGVWLVYQVYSLIQFKSGKDDPVQLLYQVSRFQLEVVVNMMNNAARTGGSSTQDLQTLKQMVYSFQYTHDNLVKAMDGEMPKLQSGKMFGQLMIRLELGGVRRMKAEEELLLTGIAEKYTELFDIYAVLLDSSGNVSRGTARLLTAKDSEINGLIQAFLAK